MQRTLSLAMALAWSVMAPVAQTSRAQVHAPRLSVELREGRLHLSWTPAESGAGYTIESTSALAPASWQPLGGPSSWPIQETTWSGQPPTTSPAFFRVASWPAAPRGAIEATTLLRAYTRSELVAHLQAAGLPLVIEYGVAAWKVVYTTIDAHGRPTRASALVVLPEGTDRPLPLASYQHGTVMLREDVPSRLNEEGNVGLILAGNGYLAVLPDYLGLGDSPGVHPYHHAASTASVVLDALRAGTRHVTNQGAMWNRQLFLIGYSQGGHATLAAQREIELHHADEFTVTASSPGAGAYDLSGITADYFLSGEPQPSPYYFPYLLSAFVEVYQIAPRLADLLRPPYDTLIPPLFDGYHTSGEIDALLPARPVEILKPEVLAAFLNDPTHPLRAALRENDLYSGWVPAAPTRLFHCRGDRDVLFANSQLAYDTFTAAGATGVTLVDPLPAADHGSCAFLALLGGKLWFDGLRQ